MRCQQDNCRPNCGATTRTALPPFRPALPHLGIQGAVVRANTSNTDMESQVNDVTTVELLWLEKRIENRIRFGRPISEMIVDTHRRVLSFAPGSIFAFVRWTSNDFGTILSRIDILRAAAPGQRYSTVPW